MGMKEGQVFMKPLSDMTAMVNSLRGLLQTREEREEEK